MSKKTRKKSGDLSAAKRKPAALKASAKRGSKRGSSKSGRSSAAESGKDSKNRQTKALPARSSGASKPAKAKRKTAARPTLAEGAKAPAFHLPRDGGKTVSLTDYAGQKLVVFFYPRADTPGCTREAIDFTRLKDAFTAARTAVIGVSGDPLKAQEAFRNKHELSVPLASDEKHEMLQAYGAWGEKSMYGRTFEGILRTTVLIGADGQILKVWRNVRVDGHADDVLAAAKAPIPKLA
jgi:thioredoxin-dependent peroxiredoxin